MRLLRRLYPPKQTAACSTCGLVLTERKRRPCPVCGDTRRTVSFTAADAVSADITFG